MGISGIVVAARPEDLDGCVRALDALPGVETHQVDRATGRIVVTQEADDLRAHEMGLARIQAVPRVLFAELVYHYAGDDPEAEPAPRAPTSAGERPAEPHQGS